VGSISYGTREEFSNAAADPLIAVRLDGDDHHRITSTPAAAGSRLRRTLAGRGAGADSRFQILFVAALSGLAMRSWQRTRQSAGAADHVRLRRSRSNRGFDVSQNLIPYSGSDT